MSHFRKILCLNLLPGVLFTYRGMERITFTSFFFFFFHPIFIQFFAFFLFLKKYFLLWNKLKLQIIIPKVLEVDYLMIL